MGLLVDAQIFKLELVEDEKTPGRFIARGPFARSGVPTANGRVYRDHLWDREIQKLEDKVSKRACFGLLDHPKDGKTSLKEASHLITNLKRDGETVYGEAEILPTPTGMILKTLIENGASVGVSSRGVGTTRVEGKSQVVQDDYNLLTFDFVADPANATSWPEFSNEETFQAGPRISEDTMNAQELRAKYPDLISAIVREEMSRQKPAEPSEEDQQAAQAALEKRLLQMVREERETIEEHVRSDLMSDPSVGGPRLALESVIKILRPYVMDEDVESVVNNFEEALSEAEDRNHGLEDENERLRVINDELATISEDLSRRYYMATALGLLEDAPVSGRIVSLMGNVSAYSSNDEFKDALRAAIDSAGADAERAEEEDERLAEMEEENNRLRGALEEAVSSGNKIALSFYAERRLANHPQGSSIRKMLGEARPSNRKEVEAIIEGFEREHPRSNLFEDVSASMGGGLDHLPDEDDNPGALFEDTMGDEYGDQDFFGTSMAEIRKAAGLGTGSNGKGNLPY